MNYSFASLNEIMDEPIKVAYAYSLIGIHFPDTVDLNFDLIYAMYAAMINENLCFETQYQLSAYYVLENLSNVYQNISKDFKFKYKEQIKNILPVCVFVNSWNIFPKFIKIV